MKPAAILFLLSYVILEVKHVQGITIHLPPKQNSLFSCPEPRPSPQPRPPPAPQRHNCGCCCCCCCHGQGQPNMHQQPMPEQQKLKPPVKIPDPDEIMRKKGGGGVCIHTNDEKAGRTFLGPASGLGFFL